MSPASPKDDESRVRRRDEIATAAIEVLATKGFRGLTHRAVDAAAGLGPGSVNYHAPTRSRLLHLALGELFARDFEIAGATFGSLVDTKPLGVDIVVARIADFIEAMTTGDAAKRVIARSIMLGEAQHDREVRELFDTQRSTFVTFTQWIVASLDSQDPQAVAETLVVMIEGLIQRQVLIGLPLARPFVEQMLRTIVGASTLVVD
ncbi:Regulatory protein TetR [Rhodococcus sp. AW25M09]|uniref:TetR/AcrR family transcriptional regulator n=1 Tax=Rhodococcus sp. AW25M09 TaxID=1268303 RepID=UPI0002AD08FB|nr:TetR family transcriptional regulator C-terminal domain-containing protein [Rhodococcus sp. AW25M09]CCQ17932.1 Regulatory protein TetR [Rhodococcus sp. AW25M09]